jgi:hypothetical protein
MLSCHVAVSLDFGLLNVGYALMSELSGAWPFSLSVTRGLPPRHFVSYSWVKVKPHLLGFTVLACRDLNRLNRNLGLRTPPVFDFSGVVGDPKLRKLIRPGFVESSFSLSSKPRLQRARHLYKAMAQAAEAARTPARKDAKRAENASPLSTASPDDLRQETKANFKKMNRS